MLTEMSGLSVSSQGQEANQRETISRSVEGKARVDANPLWPFLFPIALFRLLRLWLHKRGFCYLLNRTGNSSVVLTLYLDQFLGVRSRSSRSP